MKKPNVIMLVAMISAFGYNNLTTEWTGENNDRVTVSNENDDCYCTLDKEDWDGVIDLLGIELATAQSEQEELGQVDQLAPLHVDNNFETL